MPRSVVSGSRNSVNRDARKAFQIEGLEEIQKNLARVIDAATGKQAKEVDLSGAKVVYDGILSEIDARLTRQHTGNLRKGAFYARGPEDKQGALVGINHHIAPHANLVEYGTATRHTQNGKSTGVMPPIPIVRPAATKAGQRVAVVLKVGYLKIIESAPKK